MPFSSLTHNKLSQGYQPDKSDLDSSNPPRGGSCLPMRGCEMADRNLARHLIENDLDVRLSKIEKGIEELGRKLDMIFNNHVLIDGKFCNLKKLERGFKLSGVKIKV